jgi:hypothetical protein
MTGMVMSSKITLGDSFAATESPSTPVVGLQDLHITILEGFFH